MLFTFTANIVDLHVPRYPCSFAGVLLSEVAALKVRLAVKCCYLHSLVVAFISAFLFYIRNCI